MKTPTEIKGKKEELEDIFIKHGLRAHFGSEESGELYLSIDVRRNKTSVVVSHSITERFDLSELEKAEDLYERLTCGSGRRPYKLDDLAHPYNPN